MHRLLGVFCLLVAGTGYSQIKNIVLDSTSNGNSPCEPSIAVSLRNPSVIVAGSILNNVYVSSDTGKTWTKSKLRSPHGVYGDPFIISDYKGDFYYYHLSDPTGKNWNSKEFLDRIVVQQSKDGGKTWDAGVSIGLNPQKDQDKEWAVVDRKGNLYVTWTEFDTYGSKDSTCKSRILFSKSSSGNKYSRPVQLSLTEGDCMDDDNTVMGAVPAVSTDGKLFVTWAYRGRIYLDRSFDGGVTWLREDLDLVDQPGGWNQTIPGLDRCNGLPVLICNPSKTPAENSLYLLWADQRNGNADTDIWFARSFNYGDHWEQPQRINSDETGSHQFLPSMTVDPVTGNIYILFYDRRNYHDNQTDVYLAYSTNAGQTFTNVRLSESAFTPTPDSFFGDYTSISANKGVIAATWARMDEGKTRVVAMITTQAALEKAR